MKTFKIAVYPGDGIGVDPKQRLGRLDAKAGYGTIEFPTVRISVGRQTGDRLRRFRLVDGHRGPGAGGPR